MKQLVLPVLMLSLLVPSAWAQGALPKPAPEVKPFNITLLDNGMFQVGDATVKLGQLTDKLKSLRIPANAPIRIALTGDAPETTLRAIGGKLASNGYRRFMFVKPRHAESFTDSKTGRAP